MCDSTHLELTPYTHYDTYQHSDICTALRRSDTEHYREACSVYFIYGRQIV